ncbi:hypothetical protein [Xanthomonas sp. 3498]|uniref:hypothetical protein n=1 Tax=Xanthomonas sp. 3498 TaxID=2663863 RepID=UPI001621981F|nr:hypothetical protein [Xanthomonas sp. 3498]MBB5875868.1 hypothetical protein [Xanthomonas sp. 3498]
MNGVYGNTWSSQYGFSPFNPTTGDLTQAGKAWSESLQGLTVRQLAAGVTAAQRTGHEFPPNAARFRVLALGLPFLPEIERQLAPGQDRSGFAVLVWQFLDAYRYRSADGRDQQRMLRSAYDAALQAVLDGKAKVPEPAAASIGYERPRVHQVSDRDRARASMERAARELALVFEHSSENYIAELDRVREQMESRPITGQELDAALAGSQEGAR